MTIVGYDDLVAYTDAQGTPHKGAFIVVNSWGEDWQDRGRFYLPYDFFRDPRVKSFELSNTVEGVKVKTYEPQVVVRLEIDYTSRDDLRYAAASTSDTGVTAPRIWSPLTAFRNQGGDLPMMGSFLGSVVEFALDVSDQATGDAKLFFDVVRTFGGKKKGEGRLLALSAIDYRGDEPGEYACRDSLPAELKDGDNLFTIPLRPRFTVSASPLRYLDAAGNATGETLLVRTADGKHAKVAFSNLNEESQTITIKYEVKE